MTAIIIGGVLLTLLLVTVIFVNVSPQFGGKISSEQKKVYAQSENYAGGKFRNPGNITTDMSFSNMVRIIKQYFRPHPNTIPKTKLPVTKVDSLEIAQPQQSAKLVWFGHSSFLLEIADKNILIDPMLGNTPAPHQWVGTKRFTDGLPIEIEKLPVIDAVILSHDHYDHLDYGSIVKLKDKVNHFYTPLGVGAHLKKWGVAESNITELDWWQDATLDQLTFRCTPAQHFSGRGLTDGASTLWASWVIQSRDENIFFSGDSGYGSHFKEIGKRFGPFDFAMIECGQYNELWKEIHMFPEETVQASVDLKAKRMMPIHWGAFKLALHEWTDPVSRASMKADELNVDMITPMIGEAFFANEPSTASSDWWRNN